MRWSPAQIATITNGRLLRDTGGDVACAFIDSRHPVAGGLFVPIVAARDGHAFIDTAIAAGASAVLTAPGRPLPRAGASVIEVANPQHALATLARDARRRCQGPVVAVTGSNGKTTTRAMLEAVLKSGFDSVLCTQGNLNNHLGVPLTLLGSPHNPDAMVIEFGMSAPGENRHLAEIAEPTISVITSIALEHLEFMGSIEAIAEAEAEVLATLPAGGLVVAPGDEPLLAPHLAKAPTHTQLLTFAGDQPAVEILGVELGPTTTTRLGYRVGARSGEVELQLQLFGAHNARNAAAALAVGLGLGLDVEAMARALAQVEPVGDRGRVIASGADQLIADCYNANPGSCEAALRSLATVGGQKVAVLGDMLELGPEELQLHANLGALAASLGIDVVFGVGPRSRATVEAVRAAGKIAYHLADNLESAPGGPAAVAATIRAHLGAIPSWILLKGSRGIRLERLLAPLTA